jgi:hypothetical protein
MCAVNVHRVYVAEELLDEAPQLASLLGNVVGAAGCPGGPSDDLYAVYLLFAGFVGFWVACYHGCFVS